jgi:hypothetical protein
MIDKEIVGANWVEIKPGDYIVSKVSNSNCQLEIDARYVDVALFLIPADTIT